MQDPAFQYKSLPDDLSCRPSQKETEWAIRLIDLQPGNGDLPIECSLYSTTLGDASHHYEALSYVWGNLNKCKQILVNGARLHVASNLYGSLQRLRSETSPRTLWIDAICINQDDLAEKSLQVKRMWAVYSLAKRVLVDLGSETVFSRSGMDMVEFMARSIQGRKALLNFLLDSNTEPGSRLQYSGLEDLFSRSWWTRVWVVQEIAVAQDALVLCGTACVPWSAFEDVVLNLSELCLHSMRCDPADHQLRAFRDTIWTSLPLAPAWSIVATRQRFQQSNNHSLASLMICFRFAGTSNPCDYLYSILRLSTEARNTTPDYTRTPKEVFKEVVRLCIDDKSGLAIFSALDYASHRLPLPSWCPDWTTASPPNFPFYSSRFCCTGDRKAQPIFDGDTLSLRGVSLARVKHATSATPTESKLTSDAAFLLAGRLWTPDLGDRVGFTRQTIHLINDAATLLLGDQVNARSGFNDSVPSQIYGTWHMRRALEDRQSATSTRAKPPPSPATVNVARGRSIFLTEDGELGLAPASIRAGDMIVALYGGRVPFCLRPIVRRPSIVEATPEVQKKYVILGDCYIEKWMYGDAIKMVEQSQLGEEIFVLQ